MRERVFPSAHDLQRTATPIIHLSTCGTEEERAPGERTSWFSGIWRKDPQFRAKIRGIGCAAAVATCENLSSAGKAIGNELSCLRDLRFNRGERLKCPIGFADGAL